jgi:hypothetical protein
MERNTKSMGIFPRRTFLVIIDRILSPLPCRSNAPLKTRAPRWPRTLGASAPLNGVTTRKCANCPVREAAAMLARSVFRAEARLMRQSTEKLCFAIEIRQSSGASRWLPRCLPFAQSTRIHAQTPKIARPAGLFPWRRSALSTAR